MLYDFHKFAVNNKDFFAGMTREKIIYESRKANERNPIICALNKSMGQLISSDGLRLIFKDEERKTEIEEKWNVAKRRIAKDGKSLDAFLSQVILQTLIDGDVLVYFTSGTDYRTGEAEQRLNWISGLRIVSPPENIKELFDIKLGQYVNIAPYYFENGIAYKEGEIMGFSIAPEDGNAKWRYVPHVFGRNIVSNLITAPVVINPDSNRGIPFIAPGIKLVSQITKLIDSEVLASVQRTKTPFVISIKDINLAGKEESEIAEIKEKIQKQAEELFAEIMSKDTAALIETPNITVKLSDVVNNVNKEFEQYLIPFLRLLAGVYGVNYSALFQDFRDDGGVTARLAYVMASQQCSPWRDYLMDKLLRPFMEIWLEFNGFDPYTKIDYITTEYNYAKGKEEMEAAKIAIEAGIKTVDDVKYEMGIQ